MARFQITTYGQVPNDNDGPVRIVALIEVYVPRGVMTIKTHVMTLECSETTAEALRAKGWPMMVLQ